ncbi:MAG: hypothetical protein LUF81_01285, partial [Clostridiales bacterium]|nr:hypothetical protein [Clostridiales bacterium]
SEAESKREGILDALEQDIRARKTAYDDEIAVCRSQLAEARRQTAEYLAAIQDLTDQQQAFLENLPDLGQGDELPSDNAAAEEPQAEPAAQEVPAAEEDTIDEMIAQEAAPAQKEESVPQEPEQPQQEAPVTPPPASTARIDFSNLKFGKDYEIK